MMRADLPGAEQINCQLAFLRYLITQLKDLHYDGAHLTRIIISGQIASSFMIAWAQAGPYGCEDGGLRYQTFQHDAYLIRPFRAEHLPLSLCKSTFNYLIYLMGDEGSHSLLYVIVLARAATVHFFMQS